jgi:hypothetical protein
MCRAPLPEPMLRSMRPAGIWFFFGLDGPNVLLLLVRKRP